MRLPFSVCFLPLISLLGAAGSAISQDTAARPAPGHSLHGEIFSEGPRRRGALLPGMGEVSFPVTSGHPEVQAWFNQGVGQLHGFWYWEAERSFRTVLQLDPECWMGQWGLAMSCLENPERARAFLEKAEGAVLDKLTAREKSWIQATRKYLQPHSDDEARKKAARLFLSELEDIAAAHPDDLEARAFVLGLQWGKKSQLGLESTSHFAMDAIGQSILRENPRHPVHHYLIHLWDGDKTARALKAAAMCGPVAPGIAHMWHMPGHVYSDLERWADAAWQQEAAARVDHAQMIRSRTMPDQIHNFAHNSEWLVRNLNNLGRVRDALTISTNLIEMPRIPRSAKVTDQPDQKFEETKGAWDLGNSRLRDTLLTWERWDLALKLADTPWLPEMADFKARWQRTQLLAIAAFRTGDTVRGEALMKEFETHLKAVRAERAAAVDEADRKARADSKDAKAIQEAMAEALKPFTPRLDALEPAMAELIVLADLSHGRWTEAREGVARLKGIHDQRLIAIRLALTDFDKAVELAEGYAGRSDSQVQPQAILTDVLWRSGRHGDAIKALQTLRSLAGSADLDTPLLTRLDPVAEAAGLSGDWRQPAAPAGDLGERPPLDSLGPLRWEGWMAPAWTASSADGSSHGHADYAGRPYVALFVLGGSCVHCNAQLKAFGDKAADYSAANLPLVVVTTDVRESLPKEGSLAIFSGSDGAAFKAMDAWDDFENQPLHTTVLVDATGRMRWQHSGYEPFMRPDFLLEEAQRLFKFDGTRPGSLAKTGSAP
jgi:peroxiredoxin